MCRGGLDLARLDATGAEGVAHLLTGVGHQKHIISVLQSLSALSSNTLPGAIQGSGFNL